MAAQEWEPLIEQKAARFDEAESHHPPPNQRTRRQPFTLFAILCVSALYGTYIFCSRGSSQTTSPGHSDQQHKPAALNYTCLPGQSCWPSATEWSSFNQSIHGRLQSTIPWAAPCYSGSSSEKCENVAKQYGNGVSRTAQYGSMEFLDWETCGQSHCALNSFNPLSPVSGTCSLGRLSTYHIDVRSPDDISKTLQFAQKHGIRISIKNTGHDYFGRSSVANSLALWTHNLKDTTYHKTFQPKGCSAQYENIGQIGAGIQAQEAWQFFEPLGMLVTVGAVGSVGLAGGFGQGGGHGPLGPAYGLMVDQAVEFEVVTADGQYRTINECTDPDLFWAMRGGGGGNYAVLTSYKFQLHPAVPLNVYSFQAHWPKPKDITESKVLRDVIKALASNQTLFADHGIAGYNFVHPNHIVSLQIMPSSDTEAIKTVTSQWRDFLTNHPELNITDNSYYRFDTFSKWHRFTETPEISRNGPVGLGLMEAGRFIPRDLFATSNSIEQLTNAVLTAMQFSYTNKGGGSAQLYATGPTNQPDNSKTGVNPAWRDALWEVIMGAAWTTKDSQQTRTRIQNTISASIQPFKALTPGGGCYMNEGDWTEENWQQTFFGANYDKLLAVKRKYDPTSIFNCWKCVGWTGYDDPMYSCYTQSRKDPTPSVPLGPVE
ncbi:FAD-binding domain-containing protein [Plenodomus tracheiphilus IPT5]|uniref:FAD-binding domain-containing protein n=1 Tax=Plenodomus tracheiphilus IPT5 TaxID=1408161 RepID=A0A6A7B7X2_9PLEO|nr:FAD-binding domain-containing protein [Plenodomus tracheiphilus IPT5]